MPSMRTVLLGLGSPLSDSWVPSGRLNPNFQILPGQRGLIASPELFQRKIVRIPLQMPESLLVSSQSLPKIFLEQALKLIRYHQFGTSALSVTAGKKIPRTTMILYASFSLRFSELTSFQHVEQLLRTLNLNSPALFNNKPSLFSVNVENSANSPDLSPASVSSALLTPTDLSPARPFDIKLHSPYEAMPLGNVYHSQSSLLLENNFPVKSQEALTSNLVQINHPRHHAPMSTFPFFEPLSEPHSTNSLMQINPTSPHSTASQALYNTPLPPRRIDARLPTLEWRMNPQQQHQIHQHQPSLHGDWRVGIDKVVPDYASGAGGGCQEERSSFGHQQPSAAQLLQTPHEVKIFLFRIPIQLIYKLFSAH